MFFGTGKIAIRFMPGAVWLPLGLALFCADATISGDGTTVSFSLFVSAIIATASGTWWLSAWMTRLRREHKSMQDQIDECREALNLPLGSKKKKNGKEVE